MIDTSWGWTTYKHLHWAQEDGRKLYEGRFRQEHDPFSYTLQVVRFWAHRPKKAMSAICQSGQAPIKFDGAIVN